MGTDEVLEASNEEWFKQIGDLIAISSTHRKYLQTVIILSLSLPPTRIMASPSRDEAIEASSWLTSGPFTEEVNPQLTPTENQWAFS